MQNSAEFKQLVNEAMEENPTIQELKSDVAGLKTDVAGLKTDVAGLKTDVAGLKTDVAGLKTALQETNHRLDGFIINTNERFDQLEDKVTRLDDRVGRLEIGIVELKESVLYLGVMHESLQKDMKIVLEALVPARQRVVQIDQIEERVEAHDHRINAVDLTVKGHLADHQGS